MPKMRPKVPDQDAFQPRISSHMQPCIHSSPAKSTVFESLAQCHFLQALRVLGDTRLSNMSTDGPVLHSYRKLVDSIDGLCFR